MTQTRSRTLNAVTVVRRVGEPNSATTLLGKRVVRKAKLFVKEFGSEVPVTPYDNHFVYATDTSIVGIPSFMCTCGAPAVVINAANPKRRMFVCLFHANNGKHVTGS